MTNGGRWQAEHGLGDVHTIADHDVDEADTLKTFYKRLYIVLQS